MTFYSQIAQDQWVNSILNKKTNGFFVELGACDGVYYSNSLFFERHMDWKGICIEPNDSYFSSLRENRNCFVANDLVFSHAGQEVDFSICNANSGILNGEEGPFTEKTTIVKKTTVTLESVLDKFKAPPIIDYLSLDVEGAEYAILSTFPFERYIFRTLTVEHNAPHTGPGQQTKIRDILERNGYVYVKGNDDIMGWGHGPIDDFYVHPRALMG